MRAMAFYWQGVALVRHGPEGSYYCDTVASGTPELYRFITRLIKVYIRFHKTSVLSVFHTLYIFMQFYSSAVFHIALNLK